jgi:hypothetical protein
VDYADHSASIRISNGEVLAGKPPSKALKKWIAGHKEELEAAWEMAKRGKSPARITPIKLIRTPRMNPRVSMPRINIVEWLGKNEVRLIFSNGKIVELALPWVRSAKNAKITTRGHGLDPGDGLDVSARMLADDGWRRRSKTPGRVLRKAMR